MELRVPDGRRVWVFSDPHYNHTNICRGVSRWAGPDGRVPEQSTRPFRDLGQMNAGIVDGIESCAGQDDLLICLGDWSFGGFESVAEFRSRITCREIHLVLGNHDKFILDDRTGCRSLFTSVSHYLTIRQGGLTYRAMHYPLSSWDGLGKGYMHIHGHCHLRGPARFGVGRRMDVGLDGHPEFRPYDLQREVGALLMSRQVASEIPGDHHATK